VRLRAAGIVTEDLSLPDDEPGALEGCYRGLCVRPDGGRKVRRRLGACARRLHPCVRALMTCGRRYPRGTLGEPGRGADILHGARAYPCRVHASP
jgi:hypothetical protein